MMNAAGDHCCCGRAAAGAHHCARAMRGCDRQKKTKAQDGIERGLYAKAKDDGDHIPAVAQELG